MNRLVTNIHKISNPPLISNQFMTLPELTSLLQIHQNVLVVEISKAPTSIFKNSLWIGYRNGGMASWLSTLLPHLNFNKFCLYMDES